MTTCRSCGAQILWGVTPTGRRMPLDAEPVMTLPPGLYVFGEGDQIRPVGNSNVHQSHFASCPQADEHRRG